MARNLAAIASALPRTSTQTGNAMGIFGGALQATPAAPGQSPLIASYGDWTGGHLAALPRDPRVFTNGAFGPLSPMVPIPIDRPAEGQDRPEPRRWVYPISWNLPHGVPGDEGLNLASYQTLRSISQTYSIARACINLRVQEILGIEWDIVPTKDAEKKMRGDLKARRDFDERRAPVKKWWRKPDSDFFTFEAWLGAMLEDVFSIDALSLYVCPPKARGKGVAGSQRISELQLVDGATIRPLLDLRGGSPAPPSPAYAQYAYGVPRVDMLTLLAGDDVKDMADHKWRDYRGDQLLYLPYVRRRYNPYGFGPIERALVPIMTGIQRQQYQLDFYAEGSVPSVFISAGDVNATPQQCRELQDALNAMAGDPAWKHKIIVLPGGAKIDPMRPPTLADQFDELIMTEVLMSFDVMPMELGITPRAAAQTLGAGSQMAQASQSITQRKALKPLLKWLKTIFDVIIQDVIGATDMQWHWEGLEEGEDEAAAVEVLVTEMTHGVISIDEARVIRGHQPWGIPLTSEPVYFTATGITPLGSIDMATGAPVGAPPATAMQAAAGVVPGAPPAFGAPPGGPGGPGKPKPSGPNGGGGGPGKTGPAGGGGAATPAHAGAQAAEQVTGGQSLPDNPKPLPKPTLAHQDPDDPRDRKPVNKAGRAELIKGHPYPGQRYTHGWVPTAAGLAAGLKEHHSDVEVHLGTGPTDRHVKLSLIRTPESARGQGKAEAAMRDLVEAADHHGITLSLSPEPLQGDRKTSKAKLTAWYKRHGFVENKGRNKDYEISDTMHRTPQGRSTVRELTEDEQDLADELQENGATVHPDGTVDLYHRTSIEGAVAIHRDSKMRGDEDGLFFSTRRDGGQGEGYGDAAVHVRMPLRLLRIDDVFGDEAHVRVPLRHAGDSLNISDYLQPPDSVAKSVDVPAALRELDLSRRRLNKGATLDSWQNRHVPADIWTRYLVDHDLTKARTAVKTAGHRDRRDTATADVQQRVIDGLRNLATAVGDGLSPMTFVDAAVALMREAIHDGLTAGVDHALSDRGERVKDQLTQMFGLRPDVFKAAGERTWVDGLNGRFGLYAGSVPHAYERGYGLATLGVSNDPDNIMVRWHARPDACDLCDLWSTLEWTVGTLPGWPGDGGFGKNAEVCVPGDTLVQTPLVEVAFRRWYEGPVIVLTTRGNRTLTCTPNHPVFTRDGWVGAKFLKPGDSVVSAVLAEGASLGDPDIEDVPTRIDEIFTTFAVARLGEGMVPTSLDLDGQIIVNSEVDIIRPQWQLRHDVQSSINEPHLDLRLMDSDHTLVDEPSLCVQRQPSGGVPDGTAGLRWLDNLNGNDSFGSSFGCGGDVSDSRGSSQFLSFNGTHAIGPSSHAFRGVTNDNSDSSKSVLYDITRNSEGFSKTIDRFAFGISSTQVIESTRANNLAQGTRTTLARGLTDAPWFDAAFKEPTADGRTADPQVLRDLEFGNAAQVTLDEVIDIQVQNFAGHVFNLRTDSSFYVANGIILHNCEGSRNCRCNLEYVIAAPDDIARIEAGHADRTVSDAQVARAQATSDEVDDVRDALASGDPDALAKVLQAIAEDAAERQRPFLMKLLKDILTALTRGANALQVWMLGKAGVPDLVKVGPKGYIHGWIKVGAGAVGDRVHHLEHGPGTVVRTGKKTSAVQFDSGITHAFEHAPDGAGHFVARVSKRPAKKAVSAAAAPVKAVPAPPKAGPKPTPVKTVGRPPAKPIPIHDLLNADDVTIEAALRDVYEGKFGPYTTRVKIFIRRGPDLSIGVEGEIFDEHGHKIGNFDRGIASVDLVYGGVTRREVWANHAAIQLGGGDYDRNPTKYHGTGFGGEFNRRAIEWYRASGVHGIGQNDQNGYVWASQGFNFSGGVMPEYKRNELRELIANLRARKTKNKYGETIPAKLRNAPDLDAQIVEAEALLARLASTKPGDPDYPTAYEVSQLGRNGRRGKTSTWLGKHLKVSADEMILNPDEGEVIPS